MDKSKQSRVDISKNSRILNEKNNQNSKFANNTSNSLDVNKTVYRFKIIILGDVSVGKTCILNRFANNSYSSIYKCTINVENRIKKLQIDESSVTDLQIWDTCGDEKFKSITKQYYRDTNGVILVFDITHRESFMKLGEWVIEIRKNSPPDVIIIIVGNKADLEYIRAVSSNEIDNYAKSQNFEYVEASAKTAMNIQLLFEKLAYMLIKQYNTQKNSSNVSKKNNKSNQTETHNSENKSLQDINEREASRQTCC